MSSMWGTQPMSELEKCLGFCWWFEGDAFRRRWIGQASLIGELFRAYTSFSHTLGGHPVTERLDSIQLEEESRKMFHRFGPRLWPVDTSSPPQAKTDAESRMLAKKLASLEPQAEVNRPWAWWLVDAAQSRWHEYLKDLYYHDEEDQKTLWKYWLQLTAQKCINRIYCQRRAQRRREKRSRSSDHKTIYAVETRSQRRVRQRDRSAAFTTGDVGSSVQNTEDESELPPMYPRASVTKMPTTRSRRSAADPPERAVSKCDSESVRSVSSLTPSITPRSRTSDSNDPSIIPTPPGTTRSRSSVADLPTRAVFKREHNPEIPVSTRNKSIKAETRTSDPNPPSTTPTTHAIQPTSIAGVSIFLEVQRPREKKNGCWSIALEEMDIFTGERLRKQLLDGGALNTNERVVRAHVRPEPPNTNYVWPSVQDVQTEFIMLADREQTDWKAMVEGLETFYAKDSDAVSLKLRATLVVKVEEVVVIDDSDE